MLDRGGALALSSLLDRRTVSRPGGVVRVSRRGPNSLSSGHAHGTEARLIGVDGIRGMSSATVLRSGVCCASSEGVSSVRGKISCFLTSDALAGGAGRCDVLNAGRLITSILFGGSKGGDFFSSRLGCSSL